ncbi:MAG: sensor histidine kinase [Sciscionella sp.]
MQHRTRSSAGQPPRALRHLFRRRGLFARIVTDLLLVLVSLVDVVIFPPHTAGPVEYALSFLACAALLLRRRFPFVILLLTVPGFAVGWSQIAAMIALTTVAHRYRWGWQSVVGVLGIWAARFLQWPLHEMTGIDWRFYLHNAIYGAVVAGLPLTIGLLAAIQAESSDRLTQLFSSRRAAEQLAGHAARADERARIAREMHDVVSHQVTLIAMQAGALQVNLGNPKGAEIVGTIRTLCSKTLNELRGLVGTLRSAPQTGAVLRLDEMSELVHHLGIEASLHVDLGDRAPCTGVVVAAYRTVQESLTNASKYAPGSQVEVDVVVEEKATAEPPITDESNPDQDSWLRVEVHNGPADASVATLGLPSGGHGLLGLAERAELLGGQFRAQAAEDGGFTVRALFPLRDSLLTMGS